MLLDGMFRLIVFDFDNYEKGVHVWIFFKKPVSALLVRNFGFLLLNRGGASIRPKSFHYYDHIYSSQDQDNDVIRKIERKEVKQLAVRI